MLTVSTAPRRVLIEQDDTSQYLNFDFILDNAQGEGLRIDEIRLRALDAAGRLVTARRVVSWGAFPSVNTIGRTEIVRDGRVLVMNPFYSFPVRMPLHSLCYEFLFSTSTEKASATLSVYPDVYEPKTQLTLPVRGRWLIHDGHDFYSHHRRQDQTSKGAVALGVSSNPVRYGNDFCLLGSGDSLYTGAGDSTRDWYTFGAPVYATADGIIARCSGSLPDDEIGKSTFDFRKVFEDPYTLMGNHVILDHGNGEISSYSHLQGASLEVRQGERVRQGQMLGRVGLSGDTGDVVHLHYQLVDSHEFFSAEGLPCYFHQFLRVLGSRVEDVRVGRVDTGDIIETIDPPPGP